MKTSNLLLPVLAASFAFSAACSSAPASPADATPSNASPDGGPSVTPPGTTPDGGGVATPNGNPTNLPMCSVFTRDLALKVSAEELLPTARQVDHPDDHACAYELANELIGNIEATYGPKKPMAATPGGHVTTDEEACRDNLKGTVVPGIGDFACVGWKLGATGGSYVHLGNDRLDVGIQGQKPATATEEGWKAILGTMIERIRTSKLGAPGGPVADLTNLPHRPAKPAGCEVFSKDLATRLLGAAPIQNTQDDSAVFTSGCTWASSSAGATGSVGSTDTLPESDAKQCRLLTRGQVLTDLGDTGCYNAPTTANPYAILSARRGVWTVTPIANKPLADLRPVAEAMLAKVAK